MKRLVISTLAVSLLVVATAPAEAAQGCGRGYHRDHYGRCIPKWHRHHRFW